MQLAFDAVMSFTYKTQEMWFTLHEYPARLPCIHDKPFEQNITVCTGTELNGSVRVRCRYSYVCPWTRSMRCGQVGQLGSPWLSAYRIVNNKSINNCGRAKTHDAALLHMIIMIRPTADMWWDLQNVPFLLLYFYMKTNKKEKKNWKILFKFTITNRSSLISYTTCIGIAKKVTTKKSQVTEKRV